MALNERVRIARRFLRSIRIDADLGNAVALEGFVCPQSSADVLMTMARCVSETGQGAFTWTGPYGSGKSSLVVALSALLNGNSALQKEATKVFGQKLTKTLWTALPTGKKGWRVVPVVGRRANPVGVIGESVQKAGFVLAGTSRWMDREQFDCHSDRPCCRSARNAWRAYSLYRRDGEIARSRRSGWCRHLCFSSN